MPDVSRVDSPNSELADLRRRITDLERQAQIQNATIYNGFLSIESDDNTAASLKVINKDGVVVGEMGFIDATDYSALTADSNGLIIRDENDTSKITLWADGTRGLMYPWITNGWNPDLGTAAYTNTTATTFTSIYQTGMELLHSEGLKTRVTVYCPAATTAEVRLNFNNATGTTASIACAANGQTDAAFSWEHEQTLNSGPLYLSVEVRRLTGAGTVSVYWPTNIAQGYHFDMATDGIPV